MQLSGEGGEAVAQPAVQTICAERGARLRGLERESADGVAEDAAANGDRRRGVAQKRGLRSAGGEQDRVEKGRRGGEREQRGEESVESEAMRRCEG